MPSRPAEDGAERVRAVLAARPDVTRLLNLVETLALPDGWIGAGLVRNAVWDALHGLHPAPPADVDVVHFTPGAGPAGDDALEARLRALDPAVPWSVRNQARMHARNGHAPYASTADAVARWPETATCIAARLRAGRIELLTPHGTADLLSCIVRPTPAFAQRPEVALRRAREKGWLLRWPRLTLILPDAGPA